MPDDPNVTPLAPWHEGFDPKLVEHATKQGWDKLDAKAAMAAALTAHLTAPPPAPEPKTYTPEDYKVGELKFADGETMHEGFANALAGAAAKAGMDPAHFAPFMVEMMGWMTEDEGREAAGRTVEEATQRAALNKEWGADVVRNKMIANRAMATLGIDEETRAYLETSPKVGYLGAWKLFHRLGVAMGEANYIDGEGGGRTLTVEQAVQRRLDLMADKDWAGRFLKGGREEGEEMKALLEIIARAGRSV